MKCSSALEHTHKRGRYEYGINIKLVQLFTKKASKTMKTSLENFNLSMTPEKQIEQRITRMNKAGYKKDAMIH